MSPAARPLDVARLRADTPGCAERVHLNNAGAGLPPAVVHATVTAHLERESRIGGYEAAALCEAPGILEATLHYDAHRSLIQIESETPFYARSA